MTIMGWAWFTGWGWGCVVWVPGGALPVRCRPSGSCAGDVVGVFDAGAQRAGSGPQRSSGYLGRVRRVLGSWVAWP